jgi:uncharacterized protein YbaP (TraB family)
MLTNQLIKPKWSKLFVIIFVFGFILIGADRAQVQQTPAQQPAKSCLWSVRSGSNTVYLLGSLHVLKSDDYPLPAAIEKAYSSSQKLVFETDLSAMSDANLQAQMLTMGLYPEGESLSRNLSGGTLDMLQTKLTDMGMPIQQFERFKPWLIALTLATFELQRLGYSPQMGIDMHFYNRAKADGKELDFLEPIEYQMELLGNMDDADQDSFLTQTLEEINVVSEMSADMVTYWKAGDAESLYELMNKSFEKHPIIRDRLLLKRNMEWVSHIDIFTKETQNVLVIVGAGHLVGPESVVDLLKQKGYTVKQM